MGDWLKEGSNAAGALRFGLVLAIQECAEVLDRSGHAELSSDLRSIARSVKAYGETIIASFAEATAEKLGIAEEQTAALAKAKETDMRKLAEKYVRATTEEGCRLVCARHGPGGVRDPEAPCWLESQSPDFCFAPVPKPPTPEFRKGDLVLTPHRGGQYELVDAVLPNAKPVIVRTVSGNGYYREWQPDRLKLVHRPSTPTGPPVVRSYVGRVGTRLRGIVTCVNSQKRDSFYVLWPGGGSFWYSADELIHIASPEDGQ